MSENFMYADLSRMLELPKCAVLCRTEDEVRAFFENAKQQLPGNLFWDLEDILGLWSYYKEKTGFTVITSIEPESMSYCEEDWFRAEGYELIEFSDLINVVEIEESDQSVELLFGGVV